MSNVSIYKKEKTISYRDTLRDCDKNDCDFGTNMEKKEKLNSVGVGEYCFWEANILQGGLLSASGRSVPNF